MTKHSRWLPTYARNNCIGGVFMTLFWHFIMRQSWPTAIVSGIFWAVLTTIIGAAFAWGKERKRTH